MIRRTSPNIRRSNPPPRRRPLAFSRLRTAHDTTLRDLVHSSWDVPQHRLPPRSATDVSGAAIQAARLAEAAARDAADASAAARAAAQYARRLAAERDSNAKSPPRMSERWRRGVVRSVPMGKVWSFDLVALWHNAVRLDLAELEDIVAGLLNSNCVTLEELRAMFAWFSTFEAFVVTCLKAEEEILFPWLEQWGRIEGDLSIASRITTKGSIIRGIRDMAACSSLIGLDRDNAGMVLTNPNRTYYDGLKVGFAEVAPFKLEEDTTVLYNRVLQRVADVVASFSATLLDYFHEEEKSLPPIIESLYDIEDMYTANIERRMMKALWKCGRKDESMVMLLRAVEDAPFPKLWIQRNLRKIERMAVPFWKRRYNLGRGAVTSKFRERNRYWERAALDMDYSSVALGDRMALQSSSTKLSSSVFPGSHASLPTSSALDMRLPASPDS